MPPPTSDNFQLLSFVQKSLAVSELIMINLPGINACLTLDQLPRNHDTYKKESSLYLNENKASQGRF